MTAASSIQQSSENTAQQSNQIHLENASVEDFSKSSNDLQENNVKSKTSDPCEQIVESKCPETSIDDETKFNPLNDHDYCNANKNSTTSPKSKTQKHHKNKTSKYNAKIDSQDYKGVIVPPIQTGDDHSDSSSLFSNPDLVIAQRESEVKKGATSVIKKLKISKSTLKNSSIDFDRSYTNPRSNQRSRRHTSVTDKSEWITGEEQIDSVLSEHLEDMDDVKKEHDSSDYSAREDENSDEESCADSEDDPNKLWCFCRQPDEGKFMIACDTCKDWFHGHCVGVTQAMASKFEKQKKEWYCSDCQEKLDSGTPRSAILPKVKPKSSKKNLKKKRGRKRKEQVSATKSSARIAKKQTVSIDSRMESGRLKRQIPKVESHGNSKFDEDRRIKDLIKERKKEFFFKRNLLEQQNLARRNELGLGKAGLTGSLSQRIDSLASTKRKPVVPEISSTKSSSKLDLKHDRPKTNIVVQISTKKDASSINTPERIVATIVKSPDRIKKNSESNLNNLFTSDPIQVSKKTIKNEHGKDHKNLSRKRKDSSSSTGKGDDHSSKKVKKEETTHRELSIESKKAEEMIEGALIFRKESIEDLRVSVDRVKSLSKDIETQLSDLFKDDSSKYKSKLRSLIFNLKDLKNEGLVRKVLTGEIAPSRLVKMSPDEMASHELAKWRERENKHSIELITRDAQLAAQELVVKKTHKGEEVLSSSNLSDESFKADDTSEVKSNSEDFKKETDEPTSEKVKNDVSTSGKATSQNVIKIDLSVKVDLSSGEVTAQSTTTTPDKPRPLHVADSEQPSSEPKRIRVNIDTKLDPSNLSQMTAPLINPSDIDANMNLEEDFNFETVNQEEEVKDDGEDSDVEETDMLFGEKESNDDNNEPYDPEVSMTSSKPEQDNGSVEQPSCWHGSITMPDVTKFEAFAKSLCDRLSVSSEQMMENLTVCGRIPPEQVQDYIKKLKNSTKNEIILLQIFPKTSNDEANFSIFFDYLYTRNRYGVIQVTNKILKDFYIIPIAERSNLPEIFKFENTKNIERQNKHSLVALIVRSKKGATYKPTSI